MSGKEKTRFVSRFRTAYKHTSSRKEKSAIVDALMQCVGYKSKKHVITILSKDKNRTKSSKVHITGKIHKTNDNPKTPYQRVLYYMPEGRRKERFIQYNNTLNPFEINAQITHYRNKIIKLLSQLEQ